MSGLKSRWILLNVMGLIMMRRDGNNFFVNFGTFGCTISMVCACWPNIGTVTLTIYTPIKIYVSYFLCIICYSTKYNYILSQ